MLLMFMGILSLWSWAEFEHMGLGRYDPKRNLEVIAKLRSVGSPP